MYKHRIVGVVLILLIVPLFPIIAIQQPTPTKTAKFVLAAWDYPDQYGQGIEAVRVYQNISGSWETLTPFDLTSGDSTTLEINGTATGIQILVKCWLNNTLVNATDFDDGKNYIRHSVNVTALSTGDNVFSQQNFTYSTGTDALDPMFYYQYEVDMYFDITGGETYTALVDCEIYHQVTETEYLHDCSSLSGITFLSAGGLSAGEYGIGSNGSVIEFWIMPNAGTPEGVQYELDFTDFNNTDDANITIRYRVEGATNRFYYTVLYSDVSSDTSSNGKSTSWATLDLTVDNNKILDNIRLANYDDPASTASGNLSVWLDYIEIYSFFDQWNEVAEIEFCFPATIDEWGMNTALIIGGLIMIPASALFLVWGGKNKMSSDKLFFALIAFVLGWGLLVGGIMP